MEKKRTELRTFLVKLFNQLTDHDRQALHYSLGNRIPGNCPNQCTPSDSLKLLDSLFEQNLINEENFNYLIGIFERIPCDHVVDQLREYELQKARSSIAENEKIRRFSQEYKPSAHERGESLGGILQVERSSICIQANPIVQPDANTSNETPKLDQTKKKIGELFCDKRRLLLAIILVLLISNVFCLIFLIPTRNDHSATSPVIKQNIFYVLKEGSSHGDINHHENDSFNDAKDHQLSYADRCIGIEIQSANFTLLSIRFLYSNDRPSNVSSNRYGRLSSFMFDSDEKIEKINMYQNTTKGDPRIVGIEFQTNKERKSGVFGSDDGQFLSESFEFFTFAYAKGIQHYEYGIQMLRFVWMKQAPVSEQINTVHRSMVEICQFSFTSNKTGKTIYVTGRESSWYDLKHRFNRQGGKLNSPASYYQTISPNGPELFAIRNDRSVFYHDKDKWLKYASAGNVECHLSPSSELNSRQQSLSS